VGGLVAGRGADQPGRREDPAFDFAQSASFARERSGVLLSALRASFSSTYLTLTSIIQGVVLAYLVVVVDEEMASFRAANWVLVLTTFLVIVAAWHEYMTAVTVFVWIPRLQDSLIPFLLGGSEIMLIRSLRREDELEWSFLALGVITLVTLVAFVNMYRSAAAEAGLNRRLLVEMRFYQWLNLAFVVAGGVLFFSFSLVEGEVAATGALDIAFSTAALGLVLAFLVRGSFVWSRVIEIARQDARGARQDEDVRRRR
jgi:hypothetical protein